MSLRYKVPQNVQREDQILFFITMKQLVVLMITGGISYLLFVQLNKQFILSQIAIALICLPFALGCAFCFVKIKGLSLTQFMFLTIEHGLLPSRRYWQEGSQVLVSLTTNLAADSKNKTKVIATKNVSQEKIKNLADLIDNGGKEAQLKA